MLKYNCFGVRSIFFCSYSIQGWKIYNDMLDVGGVTIMRVKITMACSSCKQRNYNTMKNKKNNPDRMEMKKYCKFCRKHTEHKETK